MVRTGRSGSPPGSDRKTAPRRRRWIALATAVAILVAALPVVRAKVFNSDDEGSSSEQDGGYALPIPYDGEDANINPGGYQGQDRPEEVGGAEPTQVELGDATPDVPPNPELPDGALGDHGYKEIEAERGLSWKVFDIGGGLKVAELYSTPVHFEDDGTWREIDSNFVESRGAYENAADSVDLQVAKIAAADELVQVTIDGGARIAWKAEGAGRAAAIVEHNVATYKDAWSGADLRITSQTGGLKEDIVLADATAASEYRFVLDIGDLEYRSADRGIEFLDDDTVVAFIPNSLAYDSDGEGNIGSGLTPVRFGIEPVNSTRVTLTVSIDEEWLRDPRRKFPVTIDPTLRTDSRLSREDDTFVMEGWPGDRAGLAELWAGRPSDFGLLTRSYMHFCVGTNDPGASICGAANTPPWHGGRIWDADLFLTHMGPAAGRACDSRGMGIYRVSHSWEGHSMQWWPGASYNGGQSPEQKRWRVVDCNPGSYDWDLTQWIKDWTYNAATNPNPINDWGVTAFVDPGSENDPNAFKRFFSNNNGIAFGDFRPRLRVTWSPYGAQYSGVSYQAPTPTQAGWVQATIRNTGRDTWFTSGGSRTFPGYQLWKDVGGTNVYQGVVQSPNPVPTNVPPGSSVAVTIPLNTLSLGTYLVGLDMITEGGDGWYLDTGNPTGSFAMPVSGDIPSGTGTPGSGSTVDDRTPALNITGASDPDHLPGLLVARFDIYSSLAGGTPLWSRGWQSTFTATPPNTVMEWGETYWWQFKLDDGTAGGAHIVTSPMQAITPVIPPSPVRQDTPIVDDIVVADRRVLANATDGLLQTSGPALAINRTYTVENRAETSEARAFGSGWWSILDAKLDTSGSLNGDQKVVFHSVDGSQLTFVKGRDGTFKSEAGGTATLVNDATGWAVTDAAKNRFDFKGTPTPRLAKVVDSHGRLLTVAPRAGTDQFAVDGVASVDTFNRSDNSLTMGLTDTGGPWATLSGAWGISSGEARLVSSGGARNVAFPFETPATPDGVVDVTLATAAGNVGVVFRWKTADDYWYVRRDPGGNTNKIFKVVGGVESLVGDTGPSTLLASGDRMRIEMSGPSIKISRNSTQIKTLSSTDVLDGVFVGLFADDGATALTARFDNFRFSNASGRYLALTWDTTNNVVTSVRTPPVAANGNQPYEWKYYYSSGAPNGFRQLTDVCDPRGNSLGSGYCTHYTYADVGDGYRQLERVTLPLGNDAFRVGYAASENGAVPVAWRENGAGERTTFSTPTPPPNELHIAVTAPTTATTTFVYDQYRRPMRTIDAAGNVRSIEYDAQGHAIRRTDERGFRVENVFDAQGHMTVEREEQSESCFLFCDPWWETFYSYDANGYITDVRGPGSSSAADNTYRTTYQYDETLTDLKVWERTPGSPATPSGTSRRFLTNRNAYVSTTDKPALLLSAGIDARVKVTANWQASDHPTHVFASQWEGDDQSWYFGLADQKLTATWRNAAGQSATSTTSAVGWLNGSTKWVRLSVEPHNGATQTVIKFWSSDDGLAWTQIQSSTQNVPFSAWNASTDLLIGARDAGTRSQLSGTVHRFQLRNGIGGTLVSDVDFSALPANWSGTPIGDGFGNTWTTNNSSWSRSGAGAGLQLNATKEDAVGGGVMPDNLVRYEVDALGGRTSSEYDRYGQLVRATAPSGLVTEHSYDELGRQLAETVRTDTFPAGVSTQYAYNALGAVVTVTQPAVTNPVTTEAHRLQTTSIYDSNGRLTEDRLADIAGSDPDRVTTYGYDTANRRTSVTSAAGTTTIVWDPNARTMTTTDPEDRQIVETFDELGRLIERKIPDFVDDPIAASTPRDRVLSRTSYYPNGKPFEQITYGDTARVVRFAWTRNGLPASRTLVGFHNPDGTTRDITLDQTIYLNKGHVLLRVTSEGIVRGEIITIDAAGNVVDEPGQRRVQRTFNAAGQVLTEQTTATPTGRVLSARSLNYDAAGRVTTESSQVGGNESDRVTTYGYDQRGLVTAITDPRGYTGGTPDLELTRLLGHSILGVAQGKECLDGSPVEVSRGVPSRSGRVVPQLGSFSGRGREVAGHQ